LFIFEQSKGSQLYTKVMARFGVPSRQRNHRNFFVTVPENTLRKKTFMHSLGLAWLALAWRNCIAGTKRAIPSGQYRSILPARVVNQNIEFAAPYRSQSLPDN